jgi:hypothetical protein
MLSSVTLNGSSWWGTLQEEPIFLVTNIANPDATCRDYRQRYRIETFFSDPKSSGFHIPKSHLADPARLSRLLIAACLADLWMITQDLRVIATILLSFYLYTLVFMYRREKT